MCSCDELVLKVEDKIPNSNRGVVQSVGLGAEAVYRELPQHPDGERLLLQLHRGRPGPRHHQRLSEHGL